MYRRYDKMLGCGARKSSNDGDTAEAENRGGVGTTRQQVPQTMPNVSPLLTYSDQHMGRGNVEDA